MSLWKIIKELRFLPSWAFTGEVFQAALKSKNVDSPFFLISDNIVLDKIKQERRKRPNPQLETHNTLFSVGWMRRRE